MPSGEDVSSYSWHGCSSCMRDGAIALQAIDIHNARRLPVIPALHIRLLGEFLLLSGETPVTSVDLPRLQSLLAYLVLHHGTPQSRSRLAYLFWPDTTDSQAL